jgi:hypothetical protein
MEELQNLVILLKQNNVVINVKLNIIEKHPKKMFRNV